MNQQVGGDHLWAGSPDPVAFFPFSTPSAYLLLWTYRFSGDVETGKTILRDYIKATVGFEKLGAATGAPPKSLIRMFGPRGNPQAKNLFSVIGYLQKQAGVHLHVARGYLTGRPLPITVDAELVGRQTAPLRLRVGGLSPDFG